MKDLSDIEDPISKDKEFFNYIKDIEPPIALYNKYKYIVSLQHVIAFHIGHFMLLQGDKKHDILKSTEIIVH